MRRLIQWHISLAIFAYASLPGCGPLGQFKDAMTGDGVGEIAKLKNGQFDISVSGSFSGNRSQAYEKWDRTAQAACNGGAYRTIRQEWRSSQYPGILGGVIECKGKRN